MAESIDEVRRAEQKLKAKERRKIMEKERKKAVRNAKRRQREAKLQKNVSFQVGEFCSAIIKGTFYFKLSTTLYECVDLHCWASSDDWSKLGSHCQI